MHTNKRILSIVCLGVLLLAPTFAAGAASTVVTPDKYFNMNGHQAFIVYPANVTAHTPWVWYAPTLTYLSYPNSAPDWLFQNLLAAGIAIAGVDAGESYGSPDGRAIYNEFYTYATQHNLGSKPLLLGQSRGGLMMYNWAEDPGNAQKIRAIAGIYPALDLTSYPGLSSTGLQSAYHMTQAQLQANLLTINPIERLASLYQGGIPLFSIHGDSDAIVPLSANSQAAYNRYTAMGGSFQLVVVPGKGHAEIPEYFQSTPLLNFMLNHTSPPGDANRDGTVNGADLNTVLTSYNLTVTGDKWRYGDFDGNGIVNGSDLNAVLSNYNQSDGLVSGASLPEPPTLALLGAGVLGLLAYARRKWK